MVLHENGGGRREVGVAGPSMGGGRKRGQNYKGVAVVAKRQD